MTRCTVAQCAGAVVAVAAAGAGARPGADGGLAIGGVGAGAAGGVSGGPAVQGAPVSLDFPLPPALQGGGVGYLQHRGGDGAGTFNTSTAVARDRCGMWCQPMLWKPGGGQSQGRRQPPASRLWHRDGALFSLRPGMASCPCRAGPVAAQPGDQKRTVFNLLGPLVNPPKPADQVLGIVDAALLNPMATGGWTKQTGPDPGRWSMWWHWHIPRARAKTKTSYTRSTNR